MRISDDSTVSANSTQIYHYISRRCLLKALGLIGLGLTPFLNACGDAGAGKKTEYSERNNSKMQASIEQPQKFSILPPIDTKATLKIETATFAMG